MSRNNQIKVQIIKETGVKNILKMFGVYKIEIDKAG